MPTCKKCFTHNSPDSVTCENCQAILPVNDGYECPKCMNGNGPFAKECYACGAELTTQHTQTSASSAQTKIIDEKPPEKEKSDFFSAISEKLLLIVILGFCLWGIYLLLTGGL